MGPRGSEVGPGGSGVSPGESEVGPIWSEVGPGGSEVGPGGLRWAPGGLRWALGGLGWAPGGLRWAAGGLRWALGCPDDIMLLSPSHYGLQALLNICVSYCKKHCLDFNVKKSKVMIVGKKSFTHECVPLTVNDTPLEYVTDYKYLGVNL